MRTDRDYKSLLRVGLLWLGMTLAAGAQVFPTPVTPYTFYIYNDSDAAGVVNGAGSNGVWGIGTSAPPSSASGYTSAVNTNAGNTGQVYSNGTQLLISTNPPMVTTLCIPEERCYKPLTSTNGWLPFNLAANQVAFFSNTVMLTGETPGGHIGGFVTNYPGSNMECVVKITWHGRLTDAQPSQFGMIVIGPDFVTNSFSATNMTFGYIEESFGGDGDVGILGIIEQSGTSVGTPGGQVPTGPFGIGAPATWIRFVDDGTHLNDYLSYDGWNWALYQTHYATNWAISETQRPGYIGFWWLDNNAQDTYSINSLEFDPCPAGVCF
jgi:hypothetical protein